MEDIARPAVAEILEEQDDALVRVVGGRAVGTGDGRGSGGGDLSIEAFFTCAAFVVAAREQWIALLHGAVARDGIGRGHRQLRDQRRGCPRVRALVAKPDSSNQPGEAAFLAHALPTSVRDVSAAQRTGGGKRRGEPVGRQLFRSIWDQQVATGRPFDEAQVEVFPE
jgi:hypothetical protein